MDGYFQNLAEDSFGMANPNSSDAQYGDPTGGIQNDVTFGGSAVDTFPFPAGGGGCATSQPSSVLGTKVCLSDTQIETEVKRFADSQGWPHGPNVEFFMYTAHNVGSCFYDDKHVPNTGNVCAYDYYCAYHSEFGTSTKTEYIYANMPWPNQGWKNPANGNQYKSVCDTGEHPNGTGSESNGTDPDTPTDLDAADEVINVSSHEHNESITDPVGFGWWNDNPLSDYAGYENGDMCAWYWSNASIAGVSGNSSYYTNEIGSGQYFIQGEWSNADATDVGYSGCVWGYDSSPVQQTDGSLTPANPVVGQTLVANLGTWSNYPSFSYDWVRCPFFVATETLTLKAVKAGDTPCTEVRYTNSTLSNTDSYKATAADAKQQIVVFYSAYNGVESFGLLGPVTIGGEPEQSDADGAAPSITYSGDTLVPGVTVTGNLGLWTNNPSKYTVQWQHCLPDSPDSCTTFKTVNVAPKKGSGQTTTPWKLTTADTSFALNIVVTASNAAGTSDPASSGLTIPVTGGPVNTDLPTWTDDPPTIGSPDAINLGTWTGGTSGGFAITVTRCGAPDDASTCELAQSLTAAGTATSVNYTPTAADANMYLLATVVAKNANGPSQPASVMTEGVVGRRPDARPAGCRPVRHDGPRHRR